MFFMQKPPTLNKQSVILAISLVFFLFFPLLFLAACGSSEKEPEKAVLQERVGRLITLGWKSFHVENVEAKWMEKARHGYSVGFQYEIEFDMDEGDISAEELERIGTYLPMCAEVPRHKGSRCMVTETINFVETKNFGWMPEIVAQDFPEFMPVIAGKPF